MPLENNNKGATGAVTRVQAHQVGAAVGGLSRTVGGVVGAAGRGVGQSVNNTTGTRAAGDAEQSLTGGVEDGVAHVAKGVEDGSKGRKPFS